MNFKHNIFISLVFILISPILNAGEFSLKGITKTINIETNTVDTNKVLLDVDKKATQYDFSKLKKDKNAIKKHLSRLTKIESNLKQLTSLRTELELNFIDVKQLEQDLAKAKQQYDRSINRIYNKNKQIDRYSYILVVSKGDVDYKQDLENYIIDKFAIKKYDQTTTLEKSLASTQMQNIIKTEKDFGQKNVETIYDYPIRAENITLKLLKVTQNPFVKTTSLSSSKKITETINDQFAQSKVKVYDLKSQKLSDLKFMLEEAFKIDDTSMAPFFNTISKKVDTNKYSLDFDKSSIEINNVLNKLEKKHIEQASIVSNIQERYNNKKNTNKNIEPQLDKLLLATQKLVKPYKIPLTKETIGKVSLATPKIYSEVVQYKEEKEYLHRKVKSYISKINVSDLKQSDTLIDFADLTSVTKQKQKIVEFETVSILPFLDENNKIGLLVFSSIEIKDDLDESDLLNFKFKYDNVTFIPVQKGYKTIFVAQTEVTLGLVKEFLEKNSLKRYFDQYCIDDSYLPEEAKDFKRVDEEYYKYPAVCFKVDKIEKFVSWMGKKIKRELKIPTTQEWEYVASNADTTSYCWGNETPEELLDEEKLPENIYLEGSDTDSTIQKVASYPKSKTGIYDMCGNVFELVTQDGELGYKGNSFSSYIAESKGDAEEYADDVNFNLGLRLFYIKDLTNE